MDANPYQSPQAEPERSTLPKPHRELRPIIGVPAVILFFGFSSLVAIKIAQQVGSANGLMRLAPGRLTGFGPALLMASVTFLIGLLLAVQLLRQWLGQGNPPHRNGAE